MDVKKVNGSVQLTEHVKPVSEKKPGAKGSGKVAKADKAAGTGDTLAISDEAQERAKIARHISIVKKMPDIRQDKVAEAKRKIASGEYNRPDMAKKIAERMLEE